MEDNTHDEPTAPPAPATVTSTMQVIPFSLARILEYGRRVHAASTVTTYRGMSSEKCTFAALGSRATALAHALTDLVGVKVGDRVGTMMPNTAEHLEVLFGVGSMGAVFQPLNPFLMADQIAHVINHADDRVIVLDPDLAEVLLPLLPSCPGVRTLVVTGDDAEVHAVDSATPDSIRVLGYESCLDGRPTRYDWPDLPETAPVAMCYSTGTTGAPKGVVYSHRSLWVHAMNIRTVDSLAVRNGERFLCVVPVFHVLSWGVPIAAMMAGTRLILPGGDASPDHLAYVIADAMPLRAHGAPTVWTQLLVHYEKNPPEKMSLREIVSGGSAVPPALISDWEERYGVDMTHTWGMTETGPVGTVARPPAGVGGAARQNYRESQGRFPVGMLFRVVDEDGVPLTANDRSTGEIQVRGNSVTASYHHSPAEDADGTAANFRGSPVDDATDRFTGDGWLRTGDVGTITRDGFLTVHDRQTDIIRSGGEWIYSATLEGMVMASPLVAEAAVIGMPDPDWGERPLAVVVVVPGTPTTRETAVKIAELVAARTPRWMVPEYWTFVDTLDHTSVGKFDKKDMRTRLRRGDFRVIRLPRAGEA
ncbi:long-chain fatty-acid--CoA ligase [uncultured Corynebacterium sp.]|uniref:long-chain fatty-acid--CoA ligase n=1 Tax=uncultured Corynebacterium sp. TaxID=159447 RepID=UPI0025F034FD|nr:long-chain fatty-acid--CoA ligase [uncultured Corynebacterium sp.]